MRALVTGGTGFIGANLVAGLNERGIIARVLRRETSSLEALEGLTYETVVGDILDPIDVLVEAMADCQWLFHVAAVSDYWRRGTNWIYKVNVAGTKNVLAAAQLAGINRFIFTSSLAAMGIPGDGQLLDETCNFNLSPEQWPYSYSKYLAEVEVRRAVEGGLEAVIVNPAVVLGPRDVNLISGSIIVEAARGLGFFYPPGGVNYVAIEDVVAGHIAAAERGATGERYILAGENLSHKKAVEIVCEVVGRPPPWLAVPEWILPAASTGVRAARKVLGNRIPMDGNQVILFGKKIYADGSKAWQEFDLPRIPFRVAAQNTYDWYRQNGFIS